MPTGPAALVEVLAGAGVGKGDLLAVAVVAEVGLGLAGHGLEVAIEGDADVLAAHLRAVDAEVQPRWVLWSSRTAAVMRQLGTDIGSCWDVAAVHRLTGGGWRADPGRVWARLHGLPPDTLPASPQRPGAPLDLFTMADRDQGDPEQPVRPDGHLRPDWDQPGWVATPERLARWAALAHEVATQQMAERAALADRPKALLVARAESAAELLCLDLAAGGLPMDRATAETLLAEFVGPRTHSDADAAEQRRRRDDEVLRHDPHGRNVDLRSPAQVKSLLRRAGIEVPDTRAWRLEPMVDTHPVVPALLAWRKAERMATAFGYAWLDEHLGADGRLRGDWTGCDGAAGRMTASAGLHNMPAELRPAVMAEPGHVFVRADLGQIEPRVLAAVSGDEELARATRSDDLYAGVATTLGVERDIAKVAVLGAMYGQTTGRGAQALAGLRAAYPVAIEYLEQAEREARAGRDLCTFGGRRVRMSNQGDHDLPEVDARSRAAARGRYGRNAMIQGAAAELFKMWAVTVRARGVTLGAEIVLCLHDELLVQAPASAAAEVAALVDDALQETVHRWSPAPSVRFLADTSIVARWSDAKG